MSAFDYSEYISLAAKEFSLAMKMKSEGAQKRHAGLATLWYNAARAEKQLLQLPFYEPCKPLRKYTTEQQRLIQAVKR